ncbi:MAG: ThiF family adenylyltransferase [Planctomycetes bacterium]|nr:ThiF family adenylyltransferase [Planctomycetota bacterium]
MNESEKKLTEPINKAFSSLNVLHEVKILEECHWYENSKRWVIKCQINIDSPNKELIHNKTDWYIWLEATYPQGEVELVPAKQNGITKTFHHQFYNSERAGVPWRNGIICAKTAMSWLKRSCYDEEPFESEKRLKWHIERVFQWLLDAATGNLVKKGEFFELPDYNTSDKPYTIAFCESQETFHIWIPHCNGIRIGTVELGFLRKPINTLVTLSFQDHKLQLIHQPPWNENIINLIQKVVTGMWVLVPKTIVLPPWQAPMTWGEVMCAVGIRGEDYEKFSKRSNFVLMGFPIPERVGHVPIQIHWQALYLPVLSYRDKYADCRKEPGLLLRRNIDTINSIVDWQKSENWDPKEIFNRGMYTQDIIDSKIIIIGVGAFGSMTAEMLVRGGVKDILLVDHEKMEIGNLIRHTLALKDIGNYKAGALGEHLISISPYVNVKAIRGRFENASEKYKDEIKNANIVIDCSGNDYILHYIEQFTWESRPLFFSISIGLDAKRLYVLVSRRNIFHREFFQRRIEKYLKKDLEDYNGPELPRSGGIGCWHPAFPARGDEMWLWASTALKYFVCYTQSKAECTKVAVFEQIQVGNYFGGIKLVEEYHDR